MSQNNPFADLFTSEGLKINSNPSVNNTLEEIFGFTINPQNVSKGRLFLEEVKNVHDTVELELSFLHYALSERLFLCNEDSVLRKEERDSHSHETRVLHYLYSCYRFLNEFKKRLTTDNVNEIKDKIIQHVATAIEPDIYSGQDIPGQMVHILMENKPDAITFFVEASQRIIIENNNSSESLLRFIESMNTLVTNEIVGKVSLIHQIPIFNYFQAMISNETIANIFIGSNTPKDNSVGYKYATVPIGALLNVSVLPKVPGGKYEYFTSPMDPIASSTTEENLWLCLKQLNQHLHKLVLSLLKCSPTVKNKTLHWLGSCLKNNSHRGKIWNTQVPELNPAVYTNVMDGFMINMCNLMISLCRPFCTKANDEKMLKVDPTYCSVSNEKAGEKNVHLVDLSSETCFLPISSTDDMQEERLVSNSYSFVTECFFMAHRAIDLGYRVGVDKLLRQNIEIGRIERAFNDAVRQAGGNSDLVGTIKDRMSDELSKYLSLKCQLSDPNLVQQLFSFISSTSYWLCQVAVHTNFEDKTTYAPLQDIPIEFPLDSEIPNTLKCIPEFLIENIVSFLIFIRRFHPRTFEIQGYDQMSPILTFVLMYMGSQHHLRNPHIRARLAEGLESLLPFHKDEPPGHSLNGSQRQRLFLDHPHRFHIVENLMKVFVGIEMTGQSVEFEQKFNYRRPMYAIFDYLWEIPEHRECFNKLALEAEQNMEAVNPPLFLKFINLLINDAIFLLDEALANMAKLKEMQQAQDNGEWTDLNPRERTQNIAYMHHIGNLARFDNILGRDTITSLEKLTSKITIVFTHSTMVDRIAAMLNYFLLNLVGPNNKNFKVKDGKEYHFDPAGTVLEICKIYVNLQDSDSFCLGVSQDGRSYSPNLFPLAEDVLIRIGGGTLIGELKEVACKVAKKARESKANDEALSEAPDHFLDPIMSTIMTDPVILPSSKQIVDRSTIARHLLSDQTDPFNRRPLSMDQVIPNTELAEEIRNWIEERQAQ